MKHAFILVAALLLAACAKSAAPVAITAPAGTYELDPYHSSVSFGINHIGLSNYVARFTKYKATLKLDPANMAASSVAVTIDPTSIRTDFSGDFVGTHKGTPYKSFDEELAMSPKFLDAGKFPQITFNSTKVEQTASGKLRITGDLNFHGQTHPVVLDASVVGSIEKHPFTQHGALGFSATTQIKRSEFGMTEYLKPAILGDDVTLRFEGEFAQVVTPPV